MSRRDGIVCWGVLAAVVGAMAACQKYSAKPLTEEAIEQRLAMPTTEELRKEVAGVQNPLMPKVEVDLEAGVTPESAGAIAVAHNPTVQAQRDALLGAEAALLQARILPNPQVTGSADVPFGPKSGGEVVAYGVGLDWEWTSLITRDARVESAKAGEEEVRLDIVWKQWQAAEGAKTAVYDVVALREQLKLTEALAKREAGVAEQARRALALHDMTGPEASAAASAAEDAAVTVATTKRDLEDAELGLNQALGFPPEARVAIDESVGLPREIMPPAEKALLGRMEKRRIDLVSLQRGYESQEEAVRGAILGQFPKISLGISNTRDYGDFLTLGPALTIDLPIFDRNQGNIASTRATREQLYDEYVARVFEGRSAVVRAVRLIRALNEVVEKTEAEVETLRKLVDVEEEALKNGNLDAATYFAAAVNLSQKQVDLIKLRQDLVHAEISLEIAAGTVLPIVPGPTTGEGGE